MYASFLGISEALHMGIFSQPLGSKVVGQHKARLRRLKHGKLKESPNTKVSENTLCEID